MTTRDFVLRRREARKAKAKCIHCGMVHKILNEFSLGTVLMPFPGGGEHGRCLRCHKHGLEVVEVEEPKPKMPQGWTKIPEE